MRCVPVTVSKDCVVTCDAAPITWTLVDGRKTRTSCRTYVPAQVRRRRTRPQRETHPVIRLLEEDARTYEAVEAGQIHPYCASGQGTSDSPLPSLSTGADRDGSCVPGPRTKTHPQDHGNTNFLLPVERRTDSGSFGGGPLRQNSGPALVQKQWFRIGNSHDDSRVKHQ